MKNKHSIIIVCVLAAAGFFGYTAVCHITFRNQESCHSELHTTASGHDGHEDHEDESRAIELTDEEIQEIGLETASAGPGTAAVHITLPGEIGVNQDRTAHIVPRVEGIVADVKKKLGDTVKADEVIAVIESQPLADMKAAYLAAAERHTLAVLSFEREQRLWKEKISSEQDYLEKRQVMAEAEIEKRSAEQKLYALGFDESSLKTLFDESGRRLTRFEIKAPFAGTIIEKNIVYGQLVGTDSAVYVVADLSEVWVDLQAYPKDLPSIKTGQKAVISADSEIPDTEGIIRYVGPTVAAGSRTALVRVILSNEQGLFRPGLFVTAAVAASLTPVKVMIPKDALQSLEGKKCVFVKNEHGFEPSFVETGLETPDAAEILSGLTAGQTYVTKGAFDLKAKIITSSLGSHAGHGH